MIGPQLPGRVPGIPWRRRFIAWRSNAGDSIRLPVVNAREFFSSVSIERVLAGCLPAKTQSNRVEMGWKLFRGKHQGRGVHELETHALVTFEPWNFKRLRGAHRNSQCHAFQGQFNPPGSYLGLLAERLRLTDAEDFGATYRA